MHNDSAVLECVPNPDIAGPGVVISYVIAALAAAIIPMACGFWSDWENQTRLQAFEGTITGLGATQLLTSWAITISGIHAYPHSTADPHAELALILALLAGVSQAAPLWIGFTIVKERPVTLIFRQFLNTVQSFVFIGSVFGRSGGHSQLAYPDWITFAVAVIPPFACLWNVWLLIVLFVSPKKEYAGGVIASIFAVPVTCYLCAAVLYTKYGLKKCPLDTPEDNTWTFGQWLIIIMVLAPFWSAFEDFLSMKFEKQEGGQQEGANGDEDKAVV